MPVTVWEFIDHILVVCPRCTKTGLVKFDAHEKRARLICESCGHTRDKSVTGYSVGDGTDPYFHMPLRLQTSVSDHTLWAYNARHLSFLREYIQATDRRRPERERKDPLNGLLASRLPRWIVLAKNRDRLLGAVTALERMLVE